MKTLYLVRHAKAIPADVGVEDFKRALATSGAQDAEAVSKRLRKRGIRSDVFLSSPADRALETAHIFAEALDYPVHQIGLQEDLYVNTLTSVKAVLMGLDDACATAMIFGHNPSISEAARAFLPALDAELPTCGVVGIAFDSPSWRTIAPETAALLFFDFPIRPGTPEHKRAKHAVRNRIVESLESLLEELDPGLSKALGKFVRKTSKRLTKQAFKLMPAAQVTRLVNRADPQGNVPAIPDAQPVASNPPPRRRGRKPASTSATPELPQERRPRGRPAKKLVPERLSEEHSDGTTAL